MAARGSYAKGLARRDEILDKTLDVVAEEGIANTSLKQIAAAVGVTPAALLHHFDSKENLLTEVLRRRDERDFVDASDANPARLRTAFLDLIGHNSEVPGLVELFSRLSVDAADPAHPAHQYFLDRNRRVRDQLHDTIDRGGLHPAFADADPEVLARIVQATADGLQLQWLVDRETDMVEPLRILLDLLFPDAESTEKSERSLDSAE